jgi:hypothetical protein
LELSEFKEWHFQIVLLSCLLPFPRPFRLVPQGFSLPFVVYAAVPNGVEDSSLQLQHRVKPDQTRNWLVQVACIDQSDHLRAVVDKLDDVLA